MTVTVKKESERRGANSRKRFLNENPFEDQRSLARFLLISALLSLRSKYKKGRSSCGLISVKGLFFLCGEVFLFCREEKKPFPALKY